MNVEAKYGPRVTGAEPTHVFVIEHGGCPLGWIQWYLWSDYPEHALQLEAELTSAGIDLAIGEVSKTGIGLGPIAIREFLTRTVFTDPSVSSVISDPEEGMPRAGRRQAGARCPGQCSLLIAAKNLPRLAATVKSQGWLPSDLGTLSISRPK